MDRWTMEELEKTDDLEFAAAILDERARKLTPYSPLGLKLKEARSTLLSIKRELDKCYQGISDTLREKYIGPGPEPTAEIQFGPVRKESMEIEMPGINDVGAEATEADKTGDANTRSMTAEEYAAHLAEISRRALMGLLAKVEKPGDPLSEILTTAINAVEELQDQAGEEPDEPGDGGEDDA